MKTMLQPAPKHPPALLSTLPPVRLRGLGTALPPLKVRQEDALRFILDRFGAGPGARELYRRVMGNKSIAARHFALSSLEEVLDADRDKVNARFERWAVSLGTQALDRALTEAEVEPSDVDFLAVTTCTGFLCPGLSAHLIETGGLRADTACADLVGMGCGAALPALAQAHHFLTAHPGARAAVVSVEICSAALFAGDAPDLIVSNALFADGAAAAVLDGGDAPGPAFHAFRSLTLPEWRDTLRFRLEDGRLRNVLGKAVPAQAGAALKQLVEDLLDSMGLRQEDIAHWVFHAGGEKVLDAVEESLGLAPAALASARRVLRAHGNMSSPTVLFVLREEGRAADGWGVMASFGAGFSAHAALVRF